MSKLISGATALALCLALVVAGCGGSDDEDDSGAATSSAVAAKAEKGLEKLKTTVLSTGPNGEKPEPAFFQRLEMDGAIASQRNVPLFAEQVFACGVGRSAEEVLRKHETAPNCCKSR